MPRAAEARGRRLAVRSTGKPALARCGAVCDDGSDRAWAGVTAGAVDAAAGERAGPGGRLVGGSVGAALLPVRRLGAVTASTSRSLTVPASSLVPATMRAICLDPCSGGTWRRRRLRLSRRPGRKVLVRIDGAGATHQVLDWLTAQRLSYSVGYGLPATPEKLLALLPKHVWQVAYESDGSFRDGAWVAEHTGLLDLTGWPRGMRVIAFATDTSRGQLADHDGGAVGRAGEVGRGLGHGGAPGGCGSLGRRVTGRAGARDGAGYGRGAVVRRCAAVSAVCSRSTRSCRAVSGPVSAACSSRMAVCWARRR